MGAYNDRVFRFMDGVRGDQARHQRTRHYGFSDEFLAKVAGERRSKVTFEIEPLGEMVKLTVVHDGFDPGSTVAEMVSKGWPRVLSNLKTLLETGDPLPVT